MTTEMAGYAEWVNPLRDELVRAMHHKWPLDANRYRELADAALAFIDQHYVPRASLDDHTTTIERLRADVARLREFARHKPLCAFIGGYGYCDCGLDAALKETNDGE